VTNSFTITSACLISGDIGNYYYGQGHPMKPQRMRMAHNLILNYGLYRKMEIYRPHKATQVILRFETLVFNELGSIIH